MSTRIAIVALLSCSLFGCATSRPYAEITGERIGHAGGSEEQIVVAGVDGKLTFSRSMNEIIDPGFRTLLLATTRMGRSDKGTAVIFPLTARPCLRYHFVARHESPTEVHPWQLVLAKVEPIPECVAKFPQHKPVPPPPKHPTSSGTAV